MSKKVLLFIFTIVFLAALRLEAHAAQDFSGYKKTAEYTAGKLKIISFSTKWNTQDKLKSVYIELNRNFHGSEFSYLTELYLYPDAHGGSSGEYRFTYEISSKGKITMLPKSYINLYKCDIYDTLEKIARTLSHEYGHHFTYYYFMKKENKVFNSKNTLYQKVRGLAGQPLINNGTHRWDLAEIAAEDYFAYFGSPTGKKSVIFYDVTNNDERHQSINNLWSSIFNYCPQENTDIHVSANIPEAKKYWLDAFNYKGPALNNPPKPAYLYFDSIDSIDASAYGDNKNVYNIKVSWTPGSDDTSKKLEYTLIAFLDSLDNEILPVKTVYTGNELSALIGYYQQDNTLYSDGILDNTKKNLFLMVYTKDDNTNIVGSNLLKIDVTDITAPLVSSTRASSLKPDINVLYQNQFLAFEDADPAIIRSRTMVPLRKIFETLGAEVLWDENTKTVTAIKEDKTIVLKIGDGTAYKNDTPVKLDVPPQIVNNRTLVPLRFIGESFGNSVDWDGVEKVVKIK